MINIVGSIGSLTVSWDPSYEPDAAGYVICGVPGSADFAVSGSNVLNIGPETSFTYYPVTSGPFSVKIACYDSFSNPKALILSDLNFSSLRTVEVLGLASEVLSALNGELTEDHLYQALNDRLDLIDDPTTGLMTLYPRVSMTEGQYTVKMNSNGHAVGFGLANTAYNGTPLSEFMILADKFKVVHPTLPATQAQIFTVGTVNGSPVVGINGAAIVSGTLIVDQNVAVGGSVSIAGATLSFAAPVYGDIGGTKPPTDADNTSTILSTGTLSVSAALQIQNYLDITGNNATLRVGRSSFDTAVTTPGLVLGKEGSTPKALLYKDANNYLKYDASGLSVRGDIRASTLNGYSIEDLFELVYSNQGRPVNTFYVQWEYKAGVPDPTITVNGSAAELANPRWTYSLSGGGTVADNQYVAGTNYRWKKVKAPIGSTISVAFNGTLTRIAHFAKDRTNTFPVTHPGSPYYATGDADKDGIVAYSDVSLALFAAGGNLTLSPEHKAILDVAPIIGGLCAPNGINDTGDTTVLLTQVVNNSMLVNDTLVQGSKTIVSDGTYVTMHLEYA